MTWKNQRLKIDEKRVEDGKKKAEDKGRREEWETSFILQPVAEINMVVIV